MKPVSELYGRHPGSDIYVVGTGTSMRTFPASFLEGKITIGLNMAWKVAPVQYGITIAPHLNIPEFMEGEVPHPEITWITKREKARVKLSGEQFAHADATYYTFDIRHGKDSGSGDWVTDTGRCLDYVRKPTGDLLYQWSSISQTAANLAANMGARNVILVGCDNCALEGNHHAHQQHTKWLGEPPEVRYRQYYEGLAEVRTALRERGVNLLALTPFLKLDEPAMDFRHLCEELERPTHVQSKPDLSEVDHPRHLQAERPPVARLPARDLKAVARAVARRVRGA
jgi:hypothetical protein